MALSAREILESKVVIPSEMRTKEWARASVDLRERVFFMAGVTRAEVLQSFRSLAAELEAGNISAFDARKLARSELDRMNYRPQFAEQAGTIKDLRSRERMDVIFNTNLESVRGFAAWARQQEVLDAFPAQKFIRVRLSEKPRTDWPERFAAAVARSGVSAGANVAEMCALINHPCWEELSVFGTPYAPFDWGSGMDVAAMDRDEAQVAGLLAGDIAPMMQRECRSLNEDLTAMPRIREDILRKALVEDLQGLVRWDGDKLIFTDPNGTTGYTQSGLEGMWDACGDIPLVQRDSFVQWVSDHGDFAERPNTDRWEDLRRLHARLENEGRPPSTLKRGMSMQTQEAQGFLDDLEKRGFYTPHGKYPVESFTDSDMAALRYAQTQGDRWNIVIVAENPDGGQFKDVSALVRRYAEDITKKTNPPVTTESEWWLGRDARPRVLKIERDAETQTAYVWLGREAGR